eukprot:1193890-Prorocentrum_minimum.AAC.2
MPAMPDPRHCTIITPMSRRKLTDPPTTHRTQRAHKCNGFSQVPLTSTDTNIIRGLESADTSTDTIRYQRI